MEDNNQELDVQIINRAGEECTITNLQKFFANNVKELTGKELNGCKKFLVRSFQQNHMTKLIIHQRGPCWFYTSGWNGKRIDIFFDNGALYMCKIDLEGRDCSDHGIRPSNLPQPGQYLE